MYREAKALNKESNPTLDSGFIIVNKNPEKLKQQLKSFSFYTSKGNSTFELYKTMNLHKFLL
jgi:hypothetical protein